MWRELPRPDGAEAPTPRGPAASGCATSSSSCASGSTPEVKNLTAPGISNGSQPLVLWKNRQFAANREALRRQRGEDQARRADDGHARPPGRWPCPPTRPTLARYEPAFDRFCATFPDAFFVSERARVYLDPKKEKENAGRLLSAGFHSMTGYFRDDAPLSDLILDEAGRRELDGLWREFDFITGAPIAAVLELPLVRADRLEVHARPRVRLRPRRGQGRGLRGR